MFNSERADAIVQQFLTLFTDRLLAKSGGAAAVDQWQVATRQLAQLATLLESARALQNYADLSHQNDHQARQLMAATFWYEALQQARVTADRFYSSLSLELAVIDGQEATGLLRSFDIEAGYRQIGSTLIDHGIESVAPLADDDVMLQDLLTTARRFAREQVEPVAQEIHRRDQLVPESIITGMAELGLFGASIPEEYGGVGLGNLPMILVTEELSAASLPAAGSLITRPEVLAKALLTGGSERQKSRWLPPVAQGELMVAVAVTEPDTGSDVANIRCRATPADQDGHGGWLINGSKAWCTFAGRANLIALLARTDPDLQAGHRGLSLFVIEKPGFHEHDFVVEQPLGGRLTGQADDTMGYRGMHSFTLQFEDFFVPSENLIGEEQGQGRGFYYQMAGFAGGRLQTGGRAIGLGRGSLQAALDYTAQRKQFGQPLADFQNTRYQLGKMMVALQAARQLTYRAARAMDAADSRAELLAGMAKLRACRMAVDVSQAAQLLHGGWGYAEEFPVARFVADALVLPIFEGVEPILEMKVIGRQLLHDGATEARS
ncbi:MAG: acyl-CoA dehydrogenase family protein [Gammaproteobacteria bacterium]